MRNDEILAQVASSTVQKTLAVTAVSGAAQVLDSSNNRWIFTAIGGNIAVKIGKTNAVTGAAFTTGNWSVIVPTGMSIVVRLQGVSEANPLYFCAIGDASCTLHYSAVGG